MRQLQKQKANDGSRPECRPNLFPAIVSIKYRSIITSMLQSIVMRLFDAILRFMKNDSLNSGIFFSTPRTETYTTYIEIHFDFFFNGFDGLHFYLPVLRQFTYLVVKMHFVLLHVLMACNLSSESNESKHLQPHFYFESIQDDRIFAVFSSIFFCVSFVNP